MMQSMQNVKSKPVSDLNSSARFVPQITLAFKSVYNILMIEKSLSGTP